MLEVGENSDADEREQDGHGARVERARVADAFEEDVGQHGHGDRQADRYRGHEGRRQKATPIRTKKNEFKNGEGGEVLPEPERFRYDGADQAVDQQEHPLVVGRPLEALVVRVVQNEKHRPEQQQVKQPDET